MEKLDIGLDEAFKTGLPAKASSGQLQKWLMDLCSGYVLNDNVRHREIIRGITINHIILQRHIDRLNKQNTILQVVVIILATVAFFTGLFQIYTQSKYSKYISTHSTQQALPEDEVAKSKLIQDEKTKEDQGKASSKPLNIYGK